MGFGKDLDYIIEKGREALIHIEDIVTGSIVTSYQAILDVWELDCGGNWILYVKTGTTAFGHALWLLLTPSLNEILESYLHPKMGRRGGRRGQRGDRNRHANRGGKPRLWFLPAIPDIDNAIADRVPGRGFFKGRKIGPGEYVFWTTVDVVDRFLWWWLILEATEIFTTKWQSGLIESGECKALNDGYAKFVTPKQTPFHNNNLWFDVADLQQFFKETLIVANNGNIELVASTTEATALIICLGYFEVKVKEGSQSGVWRVGVEYTVFDSKGNIVLVNEQSSIITAGPGQTSFVVADAGGIVEKFNRVQMVFTSSTLLGAPYDYFNAWAEVAVSTRGTHVA